jgi:epoxide hydrolase
MRYAIQKSWLFSLLMLLSLSVTDSLSAQDRPAGLPEFDPTGFTRIFDGKTLKDWDGDPTYWSVEDGKLVGKVTPETLLSKNSWIVWRGGLVEDFELVLDYRVSAQGNSGVGYRLAVLEDDPFSVRGPQADIHGPNMFTGICYEENGRRLLAARGQSTWIDPGAEPRLIAQMADPEELQGIVRKVDWNRYRLVVRGHDAQHYLNGYLMSEVHDYDEPNRMKAGLLGVQVHVGPPMTIEYRDIFLKHFGDAPEGPADRGSVTYRSGTLLEREHPPTFENLATQTARMTAAAATEPIGGKTELALVTRDLGIVRHDLVDVKLFGDVKPMSDEKAFDLVVISGEKTIRVQDAGGLLIGKPQDREYRVELKWDSDRKAYEVVSLTAVPQTADTDAIRPFTIDVDESVLADLGRRLVATRWPDQIAGTGWDYGVDVGTMRQLVDYWLHGYDWREQERRLNEFPQFKTRIDGINLHFLHVRSPHPDAQPLVLVHGWPGSFYEFYKIIPMLTEPENYGGRAEDAFHVVCPSLPGFGFSEMPQEPGWNSQRMAEVIAKLMARLGYDSYGAQGGDWGGGIVRWLASNDGGHCIGAHNNFPPGSPPADDPMRGVTQEELDRFNRRREELADHKGYSTIQGTRPLTLGYGLNDSPAGLAAWVVDKFQAWSDHHGNLENSFTKGELLTNVMIYWVTETMPSSARIYFESRHDLPRPASMTPFERSGPAAPVGYALFPKEINVPPRAWVERNSGGHLVHWTEMPRGGHFAALETPELLAEDVRAFFHTVRSSAG